MWLQKNDRVRVKCSDGCPWTVYASVDKDGFSFKVKTLNDENTCGLDFPARDSVHGGWQINIWVSGVPI